VTVKLFVTVTVWGENATPAITSTVIECATRLEAEKIGEKIQGSYPLNRYEVATTVLTY
jgi:hypothetical protein